MSEWFYHYKIPLIFAGFGLILAILFLTIGFLKTILLVLFIWDFISKKSDSLNNFKDRAVNFGNIISLIYIKIIVGGMYDGKPNKTNNRC